MTLFELFGKIVIENSEANKTIDETADKAQNLGEKISSAGDDADTASAKFGENSKIGASAVWLGNLLSSITKTVLDFGKQLFTSGMDYNAEMEGYVTAYSVMMGGNVEAAEALVADIRQLAIDTPMDTKGLSANAQTLMQYGVAAEDVVGTLKMLGDIAMGDQTKLNSITLAYGQVMQAGTLKGQEILQLINAGVPVWSALEAYTGETQENLKSMQEGGEITAEMVHDAFLALTQPGGERYNAMEEFAQTYEGQMAKLKESADMTVGQLFSSMFEVMKGDVIPKLTEGLTALGTWATENESTLTTLATNIGNVVTGGLDLLVNGLQWITDNEETVNAALPLIAAAFEALGLAINPIGTAIANIIAGLIWLSDGGVEKGIETVADKITEATDGIVNANALIVNTEKEENLAINPPDADATAEEILAWFDSVDPELLKEYAVEPPDGSKTAAEIEAWWQNVRPTLEIPAIIKLQTFTMPNYSPYSEENMNLEPGDPSVDALMALYTGDYATYNRMLADGSYVPDGSHKTGLDFVPRDNYLARLHQGEAVLTAEEAREWRNGQHGRQEVYHGESIITGNNFYIQQESDIYDLAVELSSLRRETRRGKGARG